MFKMHNAMSPTFVKEMFTPEIVPYNLRFTNKYVMPSFRTVNNGRNSMSVIGVKLWNNLDNHIRQYVNLPEF